MRIRPLALLWLGLAVTPGFALTAHAQYSVIVLRDEGGPVSQPYAINASGESVGYSQTKSGGDDAVLWSSSGSATVLPDAGGQGFSVANAINASGQIVGTSETVSTIGEHPVLWSPSPSPPSETAMILPDPGHQHFSDPLAINDFEKHRIFLNQERRGRGAVGAERDGDGLKDPGGEGFEYASAINLSGQSVGYAETASGDEAVLWQQSGKATNLGAFLKESGWSDTQPWRSTIWATLSAMVSTRAGFRAFCSPQSPLRPSPPRPRPNFPHGQCWSWASRALALRDTAAPGYIGAASRPREPEVGPATGLPCRGGAFRAGTGLVSQWRREPAECDGDTVSFGRKMPAFRKQRHPIIDTTTNGKVSTYLIFLAFYSVFSKIIQAEVCGTIVARKHAPRSERSN